MANQVDGTPHGERVDPPRGVLPLVVSAVVSSIGDGAFIAAAPLLAAYLTRDPLAVSVVGAASAAPWLLVGSWSGALVDRLPRRRIMMVADIVRGLGLAALTIMIVVQASNLVALAASAFLVTSGRAFFDAASQSIVPQLMGREGATLARTNGQLAAAETLGRSLVGPPVGGLLFSATPWAPFAVDAASFAASGALLAGVPPRAAPAAPKQSLWKDVCEGFGYLLRDAELVALATGMTLYNLAYNIAFGTFVLFSQDVLKMSSTGFGLLLAAASIGALLTGWRAKSLVGVLGVHGSVIAAAVVQSVAWVALATRSSVAVAIASLIAVGGASTLITVAVVTARQQQVPDHLLGRVVSAFRLVGNGAAPLGAALGGVIASGLGLTAPLWGASLVAVCVLVVWPLSMRRR